MKKQLCAIAASILIITSCASCSNNASKESVSSGTETSEDGVLESALAYCEADGYIYYVTLGDNEGFHKMSSDGSDDVLIHDLEGISVNGSTAVTAEYEDGGVIFRFKQLSQTDENGEASDPAPTVSYKLDISDNSLNLI